MPVYHGDAKPALGSDGVCLPDFLQQVSFPFLTVSNLQEDTVRLRTSSFSANLNPMASACTNDSGLNQSLLRWWQMAMFLIPSFLPHLLFGSIYYKEERDPYLSPSLPVSGSLSLH